MSIW